MSGSKKVYLVVISPFGKCTFCRVMLRSWQKPHIGSLACSKIATMLYWVRQSRNL